MTNFPSVRQPALGIQDAAMLPAQSAGNLLMQRLAAAEAAFVPATTTTFDSTTSSTTLNATAASSNGGSLRSLLMPMDTTGFVPIVPNPSPSFGNLQFTQFGNQQLIEAIIASQTRPGSMAGLAVFGAGGVELPGVGSGSCGCQCVRELSEPTVIDEGNTNGINDDPSADIFRAQASSAAQPTPQVAQTVTAQPMTIAVPQGTQTTTAQVTIPVVQEAATAPMLVASPDTSANVQFVTYNA